MKFRSLLLILFTLFGFVLKSQNLINQYEDLTSFPIFEYTPDGAGDYYGEFQVFLDEIHEDISSTSNDGYDVWYEVECVSFPFQLPEWSMLGEENRWLVLPESEDEIETVSDIDPLLFNLHYQRNGTVTDFPVYSYYSNEIFTNNEYSSASTQKSTIVSA
jgi:hypothetical protein